MSKLEVKFNNLESLSKWIRYVLYAQIVIAIFAIIFGFIEYRLLSAYQAGVYASLQEAFADGKVAINLLQGIGIVSLIVFVTSALLILTWFYRASYNAHQISAFKITNTPAWTIIYCLIPLFNLWKPYQAMKEIWMASKNPFNWRISKASPVLPIWWALWLTSNFLNLPIVELSATAESLPELLKLNMLLQISNLLHIPLAIVTIVIINGICKMQSSNR